MSGGERRLLALDLGRVRIGLALSDPLGLTAQPLEVLERVGPRRDLGRIAEIVGQRGVATVVIGLPIELSGREGSSAASAREFAEKLGRRVSGVGIEMWDERLTTRQAERTMIDGGVRRRRRRQVVDALAAVLILQNYLDARPGPETNEHQP